MIMQGVTVSAIIVTYNRKEDLIRCIDAVLKQTHRVNNLIIVDNASTDGTIDLLIERGLIDNIPRKKEQLVLVKSAEGVDSWLIHLEKNTGGSGGFYTGLKSAFEELKTDYFWLMDDDGYPGVDCLEFLAVGPDHGHCGVVLPGFFRMDQHQPSSPGSDQAVSP